MTPLKSIKDFPGRAAVWHDVMTFHQQDMHNRIQEDDILLRLRIRELL